jgi:hypothetical protein
MTTRGRKLNSLVLIFSLWIVIGVGLVFWFGSQRTKDTAGESATREDIATVVQQLFTRYRIAPSDIKIRRVNVGNGKLMRTERMVSVPPEFNTLNFHFDLNRALADQGVTVSATEKSEAHSVSLHIKKDGQIVESIIFVVHGKR